MQDIIMCHVWRQVMGFITNFTWLIVKRKKKLNEVINHRKSFTNESEANDDVIGVVGAGVLYFLQLTSSGLHVKQYESAHAEGMFS